MAGADSQREAARPRPGALCGGRSGGHRGTGFGRAALPTRWRSGWPDGFLEICVRQTPGGLCSTHLLGLQPGDAVVGFIRPNPGFALPRTTPTGAADRGRHRRGTAGRFHPPQRPPQPHAPLLWRARSGTGLLLRHRDPALAQRGAPGQPAHGVLPRARRRRLCAKKP